MTTDALLFFLGAGTVLGPALLLAVVGLTRLIGWPLAERSVARVTFMTVAVSLALAVGILLVMLGTGRREVPIAFGNWMVIPSEHFHFSLRFVFDRLSVPFVILSLVLVGVIGAFANRYLHREPGYHRFFLLFSFFLLGMVVASLAGTIETLFLGWELVGLSSALLVAFFHDRVAPVVNGQRIWTVYRIADAAFLVAAVLLHHLTGEGDFSVLMGHGPWPDGSAAISASDAFLVGVLLLIAAAGKSALIPFSGWLPRAMEGPTPSSAVFYGALSVHLGAFLLLRVSPLLDRSAPLCALIAALGMGTAVFAGMASRVQTDVKSALSFASLTQVGIITAEVGFGLRYVALVHIIGHACLRTLQLVRAPSLLHDYHMLENAIGSHLPRVDSFVDRWVPRGIVLGLYRVSLERGYLDAWIDKHIARPFLRFFHWCDGLERKWSALLGGTGPNSPRAPSRSDDEGGTP